MNRQEFEMLADWIRGYYSTEERTAIATSLAEVLKGKYSHFNREKFLERAIHGRKKR
jgi:hypothetical protein